MAVEVGVRELRENLSAWLDRVASGEDVIVTERGKPKIRMTPARGEDILEQLIREGRATAPRRPRRRKLPPAIPVEGSPVTDTLMEHRRAKDY